jgi:hypothetical protein
MPSYGCIDLRGRQYLPNNKIYAASAETYVRLEGVSGNLQIV